MPEGVTFSETPPRPRRGDSVGIAVVGLGDLALKQMMPRFDQAERGHVAALVSGNRDKLCRVGEVYGVPSGSRYAHDTVDRIARNDAVDAGCIVLPSGLHAEWTERVFAARNPIFRSDAQGGKRQGRAAAQSDTRRSEPAIRRRA